MKQLNLNEHKIKSQELQALAKIISACISKRLPAIEKAVKENISFAVSDVAVSNFSESVKEKGQFAQSTLNYDKGLEGKIVLLLSQEAITDKSGEDSLRADLADTIFNEIKYCVESTLPEIARERISITKTDTQVNSYSEIEDKIGGEKYILITFDVLVDRQKRGKMVMLMQVKLGLDHLKLFINSQVQKSIDQQNDGDASNLDGKVKIKPIALRRFQPHSSGEPIKDESLNLIIDVPLQLSVELGKCRKTIKEILELGIGSVVVLDKMAGELVDVIVNGKLIAQGEVVEVDDSYGVRITEIVNPIAR